MRTDFQHLLVEQDSSVLTIIMNRPEKLNALNEVMLQELTETVETAAHNDTIRCIVITGAGRAFGSGLDLTSLATAYTPTEEPIKVSEHLKKFHRLILAIRTTPKPVIAAIQGVAAGISCNIALACDLRIAADNARLIEAFARIGLIPDGGGGFFLPRLVGMGKAMELAMLADEVSGQEAERIGLVNTCVPLAEFESATKALAQRLAKGPTRTYALIKELIYTSVESDLPTILQLEGELQDKTFETADFREGVIAFLQKRPPNFSGE